MIERLNQKRLVIIAVGLACLFVGATARVAFLHLRFTVGAGKQTVIGKGELSRTLITRRGAVIDSSPAANILALNIGARDVNADPYIVVSNRAVERAATELARLLQLDRRNLRELLGQPSKRYVGISRDVPELIARQVSSLKLPGVYTSETTVRQYPQGIFLCHVLGFVNVDGAGAAGVEQRMNDFLKGSPGLREGRIDGLGREIYIDRKFNIMPQEGADVYLTIDQNIQYMAETVLDEAMEQHRARSGWVIVERVSSGEILAMVSRPAYDPNRFRDACDEEKLNRAIGYIFEPGSTFKPAVIAAALNEGVVAPDTVFDVENGRWAYGGRILRDYHPYRRLTVADIIKKSSNIGAAKVSLTLGDDKLDSYLRAFGLGRAMGIDLPGEQGGIYLPREKWSKLTPTRIAMGQGIAVTGLQMLGIIAAIANDGRLMRPYVVNKIVAKDGAMLYQTVPVVLSRPIRSQTAAVMRQILASVTEEDGTGFKAAIPGYRVGGKTGSAQKPVPGGYSQTDYWATFAGFLPLENPKLAILVTLDEPQPLHTGGVVAAPLFSKIAEQAVRYLDIQSPPVRVALKRTGR